MSPSKSKASKNKPCIDKTPSGVDWSSYTSWELVLPPNRPSDELIQSISIALGVYPTVKNICILGSTPEYRTLCYKLGINEIVLIDISEPFSRFCDKITPNNPREQRIIGDWISVLQNYKSHFDVVLSHYTHGNVKFNNRRAFFSAIRESLKRGGLFIDCVFQPHAPGFDINAIHSIFRNRNPNARTFNDFNCIALFQSSLIAKHHSVDTSAFYSAIERSCYAEELRIIIEGTKQITKPGMVWDYSFDQPPQCFGYYDGYDLCAEIADPHDSVFYRCASLNVLRKQ